MSVVGTRQKFITEKHHIKKSVEHYHKAICLLWLRYIDVIMRAMACQITSVSNVCAAVCLGADQMNHQSSASLAFVSGNHQWTVDSPNKAPLMKKMFPFYDVFRRWCRSPFGVWQVVHGVAHTEHTSLPTYTAVCNETVHASHSGSRNINPRPRISEYIVYWYSFILTHLHL